jgi:hypothetical protein
MWTCGHCGTQNIAGSLGFCPSCRTDRSEPEPPVTPAPAEGDGLGAAVVTVSGPYSALDAGEPQ